MLAGMVVSSHPHGPELDELDDEDEGTDDGLDDDELEDDELDDEEGLEDEDDEDDEDELGVMQPQ